MHLNSRTRSILAVTAAAATFAGASIVNAQTSPTATPLPTIVPPAGTVAIPVNAPRLELDGAIVAINGTQMLVGGIPIDISRAQISRTLTTGLLVHVEAMLVNGAWLATEVDAERFDSSRINGSTIAAGMVTPPPGVPTVVPPGPAATLLPSATGREIELHGVITFIEPGFITVGNQRIDINRAELRLPSMGIGTIVKLHVSGVPGAYVAREVELIDDDDLNQAEMAAVLAGGLIIDFDDDDDRRDGSSNTSNNTSNNTSSNTSSNSSNNTSSNSSNNTSNNTSSNSSSNSSDDQNDNNSGSSNSSNNTSSNTSSNSSNNTSSNSSDDQNDDNSGSSNSSNNTSSNSSSNSSDDQNDDHGGDRADDDDDDGDDD